MTTRRVQLFVEVEIDVSVTAGAYVDEWARYRVKDAIRNIPGIVASEAVYLPQMLHRNRRPADAPEPTETSGP